MVLSTCMVAACTPDRDRRNIEDPGDAGGDSAPGDGDGDALPGDPDPGDPDPGDGATVTCGEGVWPGGGTHPVVPEPPPLDPVHDDVPIRYPSDQTQSPINLYVAKRLRQIADSGQRDPSVFMKVGDSITASTYFMSCVSEARPDWAPLDVYRNQGGLALARVIAHYCTPIEGTPAFARQSLAAQVSAIGAWAVTPDANAGGLSPVEQEMQRTNAGVAVVMFGTNDLGIGGSPEPDTHAFKFREYSLAIVRLVDRLIDGGVVPILMSIPPRTSAPGYERLVPSFNALLRGVAEARQIPFVDYYREMAQLPHQGLGDDGMHPSSHHEVGGGSCNLTDEGLAYGYNARNLVTLVALERVRRVLVGGASHLDGSELPRALAGEGAQNNPFSIAHLPFTDMRELAGGASLLTNYGPCGVSRAGPEKVYRLTLSAPASLRAFVTDVSGGTGGLRLSLLSGSAHGEACLESAETFLDRTLPAGTYFFSVDADGPGGEYLFTLMECALGDPACR